MTSSGPVDFDGDLDHDVAARILSVIFTIVILVGSLV